MKKRITPRLSLHKETLRSLTSAKIRHVLGREELPPSCPYTGCVQCVNNCTTDATLEMNYD